MILFQKEMSRQLLQKVHDMTDSVMDVVDYIDQHIEVWEDNIEEATSALSDIRDQCASAVNNAFEDCIDKTDVAYKDCANRLPAQLRFMCSPVELGQKICGTINKMSICSIFDPTIKLGEGLKAARVGIKHWFGELEREIQFELDSQGNATFAQNIEKELNDRRLELNTRINTKVEEIKSWFESIHFILFIATIVLLPCQSAIFYIQQKRADRNNEKVEERLWLTHENKGKMGGLIMFLKLLVVFAKFLFVGGVLLLDYGIYHLGDEFNRNWGTELVFNGTFEYRANMQKNTFLSSMVSNVIPSINVQTGFNSSLNTSECKPQLTDTVSFKIYLALFSLFILLVVMTIISYWATKWRTSIYRYFFPLENDNEH